jgi:hypothetical protein
MEGFSTMSPAAWKFLSEMPHELSFAIIIVGIIAIVIISLRGHLKAMFGKKTIEIGGSTGEVTNNGKNNGRETVTIIKRTCGDCILMLMSEREKYEFQINQETNKILRSQMTFAEQKLMEIHSTFMQRVINAINRYAEKTPGSIDEGIQYKLAYGLLKDAILSIKDENRRSFKENGFYYLDNTDFLDFISNKVANTHSMLIQFIRNIFPDRAGIIHPDEIIEAIGKEHDFFSKAIKDIYTFAQSARRESDENIIEIKNEFKKWIDDFSKPQKEIEA